MVGVAVVRGVKLYGVRCQIFDANVNRERWHFSTQSQRSQGRRWSEGGNVYASVLLGADGAVAYIGGQRRVDTHFETVVKTFN